MQQVLVVDDDPDLLQALHETLEDLGYAARSCRAGEQALQALEHEHFDAVLVDFRMPAMDGAMLCERIAGNHPTVPVVLMTGYEDTEAALAALRAGARDFLRKPFSADELGDALRRAFGYRQSMPDTERLTDPGDPIPPDVDPPIVGSSVAMRDVVAQVARLAPLTSTVLVTGESGTGKELVARTLHALGDRRSQPFVALNCAALPDNLFEAELFGHTAQAYTDAVGARDGLLVSASGGTVFLDEIGAMPLAHQPKLLRALEERTVRPVGSTSERSFDARIVAATNADLNRAVEEGTFRRDLLFRLEVAVIQLPPLRDRGDDVIELAEHFLSVLGAHELELTPDAREQLRRYPWPGNVREVDNCMRRAVALTRGGRIGFDDLPSKIRRHPHRTPTETHQVTLEMVERAHIESVLRSTGGNKTAAARILGIDRTTLHRKISRYEAED